MYKKRFLLFFNFLFMLNAQDIDDSTQYIIHTSNSLKSSADILRNFYNNSANFNHIPNINRLITKVVTTDDEILLNYSNFSEYIHSNYSMNEGETFIHLKYLLIIGDEDVIEPVFHYQGAPSDDYFSEKNWNGSINQFPTNPLLSTGRLLVNNNTEAINIIDNIKEYISEPQEGSWKSELLLFCDNQYKNNIPISQEIQHTVNSNLIYQDLKNKLNITCLYGAEYPMQESLDWYIQPEYNFDLIQRINQGLAIINYIGHGTSEILADEDILTISDIDLISISNNKLPIWVVGTCSFGNYLNENCFAERLLKNGNAAIAVISSTENVGFDTNLDFTTNFFSLYLDSLISENSNDRIGDILRKAKLHVNFDDIPDNDGINYKFHLFGDPAMPLNLSEVGNDIININSEDTLLVGAPDTLNVNNPYSSDLTSLKIKGQDINKKIYYEDDSLEYSLPSNLLFNDSFIGPSKEIYLPLNINLNDTLELKIHNDYDNTFQNINDIYIEISDDEIENNDGGPHISFFHKNKVINNGDYLKPPYEIKILVQDEHPINISGIDGYSLRFWIDNNQNQSIILDNDFIPNEPKDDQFNYSGYIDLILEKTILKNDIHTLKFQAWDILLESTIETRQINIYKPKEVYNVYNFPNPFKDKTYFTFLLSESFPMIDVQLDIYTLNGEEIFNIKNYSLQSSAKENEEKHTFYRLETTWNGKDKNGLEVPNGTYIYKIKIHSTSDGSKIHEGIYKLSKIK